MSATLKAIPDAIAAADPFPPGRVDKDLVVPTRMTALTTLVGALDAAGYKNRVHETVVYAEVQDGPRLVAFVREGSAYAAHFEHHTSEADAMEMLQPVVFEYQRLVQEAVYERICRTAPVNGMQVVEEVTDSTNAIVLTLEVVEEGQP